MVNSVENKAGLPTTARKAKILIVEDETSVAMMMVYLLTRAECDAQPALNAERAVELAQEENFDLVTLDIDLPGTGGFEIYRRLTQLPNWQGTPVVFVSGRSNPEDRQQAFELGAADFIEKPFGAEDFVSRILSCIRKSPGESDVLDKRSDANTQSLCNTP